MTRHEVNCNPNGAIDTEEFNWSMSMRPGFPGSLHCSPARTVDLWFQVVHDCWCQQMTQRWHHTYGELHNIMLSRSINGIQQMICLLIISEKSNYSLHSA
jgi:hypothetical protein